MRDEKIGCNSLASLGLSHIFGAGRWVEDYACRTWSSEVCVCVTSYNKQDFHYKSLTNTLQHRTIVDTCANKAIPQWGKRRLITSAYPQSCSEMATGPRHEQAFLFCIQNGVCVPIFSKLSIFRMLHATLSHAFTCNIPTQHCQTQHCHTSHGHTRSISPISGT